MTPEQEKKLDLYVIDIRNTLDQFKIGVRAVHRVETTLLEFGQDIAKLKASGKTTRSWLRRLIDDYNARTASSIHPPREPLPSIGADDSGSIEIAVLGQRANFTGKTPVRAALLIVGLAAAIGCGYAIHEASGPAAPQQQQETKK